MRVDVAGLCVELAGRTVLADAALGAEPGTLVAVVGPNGSGKSTLVRALQRALRPVAGTARVGGDDVWGLSARESARRTAVVAQHDGADVELTVAETVALGRLPHHGRIVRHTADDAAVVGRALADAGVAHLRDRVVTTLSGGERQRVAVARALAQQAPVLVLDEPTNHLDVRAQLELLELVAALPATVVVVLHDLDLAAAYADHVVLLDAGRVVAAGDPVAVLTPARLAAVYGVPAHCTTNPLTGRLALQFGPPVPAPPVPTGARP